MTSLSPLLAISLIGCGASEGAHTGETETVDSAIGDTDPTETREDTAPPETVGTTPTLPLSLPEFAVSNQYGLVRSNDHLVGSRSVVWFFTTGWTDC